MRSRSWPRLGRNAIALCLSFSLAALWGCGAVSPAEVSASNGKSAPKTRDTAPDIPDDIDVSKLFMVSGGDRLYVGEDLDLALNADGFKHPEKSTSVNRLPPGLDASYQCYGWETSGRAFGVIATKRKVLLALDTYENADQQAFDDLKKLFSDRFGEAKSVTSSRVQYYFWEDRQDRLMLCSTLNPDGAQSFSVAIGVKQLMDFFRMDAASATEDSASADDLFQRGK